MKKKAAFFFFLILALVALDQWIKIYIKLNYPLGEVRRFADWFIIHFTENPGMAFGMEWGGRAGKIALSVFRLLASIVGIVYLRYIIIKNFPVTYVFSLSLILAGTIGNILDSVFYGVLFTESTEWSVAGWAGPNPGYAGWLEGHVVDMFYFPIISGYYPSWVPFVGGQEFLFFRFIFNLADACISVGVFLLILFQKNNSEKKPGAEQKKDYSVNHNISS
ncbi:MAG: lipoprotein signal peptidase [Bacteroidia bacterium]|nr:lipoprotein signal peptidase [Bacteroidia bacterium]